MIFWGHLCLELSNTSWCGKWPLEQYLYICVFMCMLIHCIYVRGIWSAYFWAEGQFPGCCVITQWQLALCPFHHFMWFPSGWWVCTCCGESTTGEQCLCSTLMQLWHWGWRQWLSYIICKKAPCRITRHQAVNDVVARAFMSDGLLVTKEPIGLARQDGPRPDGLTLIPCQCGKLLTWDVTVAHKLADFYVNTVAHSGGSSETGNRSKVSRIWPAGTARSLVPTDRGRDAQSFEWVQDLIFCWAGP